MISPLFWSKPHLVLAAAAFGLLGIAYGFQFAGYLPCELCWWQRYPYMAMVPMGIMLAFLSPNKQRLGLVLLVLLLAAELGIAIFHVGVEQAWWEGLATCSGTVDFSGLSDDEMLALMQQDIPRCDEAAWSLFGVSMAGWNGIAAFILLGYACVALAKSGAEKLGKDK